MASTEVLRSEPQVEAPALKNWKTTLSVAKPFNVFSNAVSSVVSFVKNLFAAPAFNYAFVA